MAQFLLLTTLFTIAGLIATAIVGFQATAGQSVANHILFAIVTMLFGLFSQSMTMFFFIGTGKEIKDKAKGEDDEDAVVRETKLYKAKVFPAAFYSMIVLMVTFIVGGGVHRGQIPPLVHAGLWLLTLVMYARAYWVEIRAMNRNADLMVRFLRDE